MVRQMAGMPNLPVIQGADARTLESMARWIANTGGALGAQDIASAFALPPAMVEEIVADKQFAALVSSMAETVLKRDGTRAAVSLLVSVVRNEDAALGHRMKAAELILTRTMAPAGAEKGEDGSRDLNEMTVEELRGLCDQLEGQIADRAEPIGGDVDDAVTVDPVEDAFD